MPAAPSPSRFVFQETKLIAEATIGSSGGTIQLPERERSLAGIRITAPPQAVAKETTFRIYRDLGELTLHRGKSGGIFLRIDCGPINEFNQPVDIEIPFDPQSVKKGTITGYAIDEDGLLSPLSVKQIDRGKSKVVFSIMQPLRLVWVYTGG